MTVHLNVPLMTTADLEPLLTADCVHLYGSRPLFSPKPPSEVHALAALALRRRPVPVHCYAPDDPTALVLLCAVPAHMRFVQPHALYSLHYARRTPERPLHLLADASFYASGKQLIDLGLARSTEESCA